MRDNRIAINGVPVPLMPDGVHSGGYGFTGAQLGLERFGAEQHVVMFAPNRSATDFDTVVPAGHLAAGLSSAFARSVIGPKMKSR